MYKISTEQVNVILAYLGKRPYAEVAKIAEVLLRLEQLNIESKETKK